MTKTFLSFAIWFVVMFMLAYAFLAWVDALPEPLSTESDIPAHQEDTPVVLPAGNPELPLRVVAPAIGMENNVLNPQSTDVETLDEALLKGTIRYPTSAQLGVDGTVLLFGHSSYLPIVHNKNYKAFNGIQKLKEGDTVSVYSGTTEYRYVVESVRLADAEEDVVELPTNGKFLKLITCDTFGKKSSRFIVEASFEGVYAL